MRACPNCGHRLPKILPAQELYNIQETAAITGLSRWTVSAMCKDLQFPGAIPRGRRGWRIPRASIEAWGHATGVWTKAQLRRALDRRCRPTIPGPGRALSARPASLSGGQA